LLADLVLKLTRRLLDYVQEEEDAKRAGTIFEHVRVLCLAKWVEDRRPTFLLSVRQTLKLERQQKNQLQSQISRLTVMCGACSS
jgi:hypothetical protein